MPAGHSANPMPARLQNYAMLCQAIIITHRQVIKNETKAGSLPLADSALRRLGTTPAGKLNKNFEPLNPWVAT